MNLHLIIIGYNRAESLDNLIRRTWRDDFTYHLFQHSTNPQVESVFNFWSGEDNVVCHRERVNRGLSLSWNEGIIEAQNQGAEAIIIVNDDVAISQNDLIKLAEAAIEQKDKVGILSPWGWNQRMGYYEYIQYSCFAITQLAIKTIGYFDVNFFPIYFEDTDYTRRLFLAGVKVGGVDGTTLDHVGTATVHSDENLNEQNKLTFQLNANYYIKKWGGYPGNEVFIHPFNELDRGLKIKKEDIYNPYPAFERKDREVVKI